MTIDTLLVMAYLAIVSGLLIYSQYSIQRSNSDVMMQVVKALNRSVGVMEGHELRNGQTARAVSTELPQLSDTIRWQMTELSKWDSRITAQDQRISVIMARLEQLERERANDADCER